MKNYLDLTGKVALITGASSGIGAAAATVMSDLGAKVAVGYHRNKDGAERVCASISSAGGVALAIQADVREAGEIRTLIAEVTGTLGPIDILVNNAGSLVGRQQIADTTEERLDEILALNLKSAVLCAQGVAPAMVARKRGAIVNVASIAGRNGGGPGAGAYAAAKGGLITFTKSMAKELAPHGVRVNAVSPGRDRHAVSRGLLDAGDVEELCRADSTGPDRQARRMRDGDRLSRVRRRQLHHRRDDRGEWRTVDAVSSVLRCHKATADCADWDMSRVGLRRAKPGFAAGRHDVSR